MDSSENWPRLTPNEIISKRPRLSNDIGLNITLNGSYLSTFEPGVASSEYEDSFRDLSDLSYQDFVNILQLDDVSVEQSSEQQVSTQDIEPCDNFVLPFPELFEGIMPPPWVQPSSANITNGSIVDVRPTGEILEGNPGPNDIYFKLLRDGTNMGGNQIHERPIGYSYRRDCYKFKTTKGKKNPLGGSGNAQNVIKDAKDALRHP